MIGTPNVKSRHQHAQFTSAWSIQLRAYAMPSVPMPPVTSLTDMVPRCRLLAAHGARSCLSARTQPPTATGAPSQTSTMPCHTMPYRLGEDAAAHGHWYTFTDLYRTMPYHRVHPRGRRMNQKKEKKVTLGMFFFECNCSGMSTTAISHGMVRHGRGLRRIAGRRNVQVRLRMYVYTLHCTHTHTHIYIYIYIYTHTHCIIYVYTHTLYYI